jgi:phosphotransferase system HPr (HPr) family protein
MVMSEITAARTVTVTNPQGLHLRPAGLFAQVASRFHSRIELVRNSERVDGKSVMSIILLAVEQGGQFLIEATGPDSHDALAALAELVERGFSDKAPPAANPSPTVE